MPAIRPLPERFRFAGPAWPDEMGFPQTARIASAPSPETPAEETDTGPQPSASKTVEKSYLIPAFEIPIFILALNAYLRLTDPDKIENGKKVYDTSFASFWDHVSHGSWQVDRDDFTINQVLHPYQGSIYHGIARSSGLNFWESLGYTFAGSLLWETAGETTPPSINDQVASGIGGSFLGEPLFRMASLILEGRGDPGPARELAAAVFSPPTGFNRLLLGNRFKAVFPSRGPAFFWRAGLGANLSSHTRIENSSDEKDADGNFLAAFSMDYGLPGKPGYAYSRPFDYFHFAVTLGDQEASLPEEITACGLLLGSRYASGDTLSGVWGLYGSYDYLSSQIFRASSTALSLGTTFEWRLSPFAALQGTALGGFGYGAGASTAAEPSSERHYGTIGLGLLSLRLLLGASAMVEASAREYYIGDMGYVHPGGDERISRQSIGATLRIYGPHALGIHYLRATRSAHFSNAPDPRQEMERVSLLYSFLSDIHFGLAGF